MDNYYITNDFLNEIIIIYDNTFITNYGIINDIDINLINLDNYNSLKYYSNCIYINKKININAIVFCEYYNEIKILTTKNKIITYKIRDNELINYIDTYFYDNYYKKCYFSELTSIISIYIFNLFKIQINYIYFTDNRLMYINSNNTLLYNYLMCDIPQFNYNKNNNYILNNLQYNNDFLKYLFTLRNDLLLLDNKLIINKKLYFDILFVNHNNILIKNFDIINIININYNNVITNINQYKNKYVNILRLFNLSDDLINLIFNFIY